MDAFHGIWRSTLQSSQDSRELLQERLLSQEFSRRLVSSPLPYWKLISPQTSLPRPGPSSKKENGRGLLLPRKEWVSKRTDGPWPPPASAHCYPRSITFVLWIATKRRDKRGSVSTLLTSCNVPLCVRTVTQTYWKLMHTHTHRAVTLPYSQLHCAPFCLDGLPNVPSHPYESVWCSGQVINRANTLLALPLLRPLLSLFFPCLPPVLFLYCNSSNAV